VEFLKLNLIQKTLCKVISRVKHGYKFYSLPITLIKTIFSTIFSTIFHRFLAANYDSVLSFFPARQVSETILNESSKSTEWLQKDTTKYFPKFKVYVVSLIIGVVSKTGFGNFLAHLVCLKSEK
jgi:hypothetical protein